MTALTVYLSGEIHTDWREQIETGIREAGLDIRLLSPITDHASSDDCGARILGEPESPFWRDKLGASVNAIRTRKFIEESDVVVVRFGDKYKQWNAAFDAGYAAALGKSLITLHDEALIHPLKEVNGAALASAREPGQVVQILDYVLTGRLPAQVSSTAAA